LNSENITTGTTRTRPTRPSASARRLSGTSSETCQRMAADCMRLPENETSRPIQSRRKLRCCSAANKCRLSDQTDYFVQRCELLRRVPLATGEAQRPPCREDRQDVLFLPPRRCEHTVRSPGEVGRGRLRPDCRSSRCHGERRVLRGAAGTQSAVA